MDNEKESAKFSASIPPELSKEEESMFRHSDFVGLEYLRCENIRANENKSPRQRERLAKQDAEEKLITENPNLALKEAHEAIDRGTSLLLKLIRSGRLAHEIHPTAKGEKEGLEIDRHDDALECLASRIEYLNRQLVRLAGINSPGACRHLWYQSKSLCEAFTRLALVFPKEFKQHARNSITMPSLRAKNPKYTADSEAIAEALELAGEKMISDISDNRSRAGAFCHLIVARILESIRFWREYYQEKKESLSRLKQFSETAEKYRDTTLEQFLKNNLHPNLYRLMIRCSELPEWPKGSEIWWKNCVLPMVKEEFTELSENPAMNLALWEELSKGGERDSVNDRRRYMEKLCRNKFDQAVKNCP